MPIVSQSKMHLGILKKSKDVKKIVIMEFLNY